jgi:hypothetical protein
MKPCNSSLFNNNESLYLNNKYPLCPKLFLSLPLGTIKPAGWLKRQLITMKNGMCGQLDILYSSVLGDRNGWLGGDGDVWERGPYWLDGLVPLAYILDDQELIKKIQPWIEWSINNQQVNGYFGPIPQITEPIPEPGLQRDRAQDWWPKMVMLKVFQQYYTATNDNRVIELMLKYFRYQLNSLPSTPLGYYSWWGAQRGGDNLLIVYWLYNLTGHKFLLELGELIHKQVFDWTDTFLHSNSLATDYKFHGVNLAQGIKEPVIYYQQKPEKKYIDAVRKALFDIRNYQGQAQGMFGADEQTRGNDPVQGSELCSAVELMYSLESMMVITGDVSMMDHLEKIAYNALPAQITNDYNARQYYQQANQVMVTRGQRNFVTSHSGTDLCFGLLSGFPCCTTNMHQGWPKFIQNLWFGTEDCGLAALVYGSSEVTVKVANGEEIRMKEQTNYPFDEKIRFTCRCKKDLVFPFYLRIPEWCERAIIMLNGEIYLEEKGNQILKINRKWKDNDVIELILPMNIAISRWFNNSIAVERGPLLYALRIEEDWKDIKNEDAFGDYKEVRPLSPWNYGVCARMLEDQKANFEVIIKNEITNNPWNLLNAPVQIITKGKIIPEWKIYNETAGPLPYSNIQYLKEEPEVDLILVPYGCTTLRISQFPVVS